MKIFKKSIFTVLSAAVLAMCLPLVGCSEKAAEQTPSTGESTQTSQNSQKEISGKLLLYTSQPDADAQALINGFQKKYSGITVEVFRSGTEEVISKVLAESKAGSVQADVLLVADAVTFEGLKSQDLLMSYKSPELGKIPGEFADPDGMYTGTKVISTVLAVNTKNVSKMPDSWNVLVDENTKGQSIMPSPLYSGAAAYNVGVFSRQKELGWEYFSNLKNNQMTVTKGNGNVLKAVAAGEKNYGMLVDYMAANAKKEGSPVELVFPKEGIPAITEPVGIVKNTKNPDAAKAMVDFILSEEGQLLAVKQGYIPIREGVKAPEGLKSIKDMKIISSDIKELSETKEDDKKKFESIFGN